MTKRLKLIQGLLFALCLSWTMGDAHAAELAGITMPNQKVVDGTALTLNGMALRTFSLLQIRVFVVGLYLALPSHNSKAILDSQQVKLLHFVFLRDVDAAKARKSWQKSIENNCPSPCQLPPSEVAEFLASVPAMHKGDTANVLFTPQGVNFIVNGRSLGEVTDPAFARVILLGYIGPQATPETIRQGILGLR